ncbi:MAG: lysophospholipid acyltransferase family protein [Myxococcaceae bacterium]
MPKLGNDPFLRGAAPREDEGLDKTTDPAGVALPKTGMKKSRGTKKPAKAAVAKKAKPEKRTTSAKKPAPAKTAKKAKKTKRGAVLDTRAEESLRERISHPPPRVEEEDEKTDTTFIPLADLEADDETTPSVPGFGLEPRPSLVTLHGEPVLDYEEEDDDDEAPTVEHDFTEGELISEETRPPEHRLAPAPFDPAATAKSTGALALAKDILFQALDRPGLRTVAETAGGVIEVMRTATGLRRAEMLDDFGKDENLESALAPITNFFFEKYWRVHIEGSDELPLGPCLLVANHSGALPFDGPVLAEAVKRERPELEEPRWLVEDQVFYAPFLGTLLNRLGAIRASPENAARLLDERRPVIVFPEGIQGMGKPYRERYQLKRFGRGGFAKLAMRTNTPIIPVAIVGAEESMPLLGRLPGKFFGFPYLPLTPLGPMPLPARWSIRFGPPLYPETSGAGSEADLSEVHRLTELTRQSIDGMLKARLKDRKSIFM